MARYAQERILITGATGFVGSWLVEEIQKELPNIKLFGTTHSDTGNRAGDITLLSCDITRQEDLERVVQTVRPTGIVHLAGIASAAGSDAAKLHQTNADAAVNLLRAVADLKSPCRVLLASSGYVYGTTEPGKSAREDDTLRPQGAYAESKTAMESAATEFLASGTAGDVSVVLARAFNHTGPRQTDAFVVPAFAKQIARIEAGLEPPVVRTGNLEALRDFLHVRDVVRAYRLLLCDLEVADTITIVNVASGIGIQIQAMLDQLVALSSATVTTETDPSRLRPSDLPECIGSYTRLQTLTGWEPTISLTQTLRETLDWWRAQTK